jgi:hypothetical protein
MCVFSKVPYVPAAEAKLSLMRIQEIFYLLLETIDPVFVKASRKLNSY